MNRSGKVVVWLIGLVILVVLIKLPLSEEATETANFSLPLFGKTIVIDPGHGGWGSGWKR